MQSNLYLNFLQASRELSDKFTNLNIDPICKLVLEEIALGMARNKPLKVTEVIEFHKIASRSTLHRKLGFLEEAGLIKMKTSSIDRRTKFLIITDTCKEYFEALSKSIEMIKCGTALN